MPWPCNTTKAIAHFPESREIWSFGSGYGGNALLGKKCFALRIASVMAHEQGWLAEHMLILKLTAPSGAVHYVAGAFPSACGKTNLAMLVPTIPGWTVETIGDDIAWMRFGDDGRLWAINPESGFFGVAPGTGYRTNPNAMATLSGNTVFTNTALTPEGDTWWEGMTPEPPPHLIDWHGEPWTPGSGKPAAHPNARFTVPAAQCPSIAPEWEEPDGRAHLGHPLRRPPRGHGAARVRGALVGARRLRGRDDGLRDDRRRGRGRRQAAPRPVRDAALLRVPHGRLLRALARDSAQRPTARKLPRIFQVNWFRKDADNRYLWPGFGENSRVLAWIAERCEGTAGAVETAIGLVPAPGGAARRRTRARRRATSRRCWPSTWRAGRPSCRAWPSISRPSATACRPALTAQLEDLRARLARRLATR